MEPTANLKCPCTTTPARITPQIGEEAQQSVIRKVFQQVAQRPDSFCNYLDGRCVGSCGSSQSRSID